MSLDSSGNEKLARGERMSRFGVGVGGDKSFKPVRYAEEPQPVSPVSQLAG